MSRNRAHANGLCCPKCKGFTFSVAYTRHRGGCIMRVRKCDQCGRKLATMETPLGSAVRRASSLPT